MSLPLSSVAFNIKNAKTYTPVEGQEHLVMAYYMLPADKVTNRIYGMGMFLGGFSSREKANAAIAKVADENAKLNPHFRICESGKWFIYTPEVDPKDVDFLDRKGQEIYVNQQLRDQEERLQKIQKEEEQRKQAQELEMQLLDPDSLLFYSRIQMQKKYQSVFIEKKKQELELAQKNLERIEGNLKEIETKHEDYSSRWEKEGLPLLQE